MAEGRGQEANGGIPMLGNILPMAKLAA